jgi:hypothetical protein
MEQSGHDYDSRLRRSSSTVDPTIVMNYKPAEAHLLSFLREGAHFGLKVADLLSDTCLEYRIARMDRMPKCGYGVYQQKCFIVRQETGKFYGTSIRKP